jgi:Tol biopolymer transport system component/predicted Ser/Thr protein kinase
MGDVYLAEDQRLNRQVALKFLATSIATDPVRLERFEREAQVAAALNHPNIVTVHSIERDGDTLFMAMEYLDGRTLDEIIAPGGLPLKRLLPLAIQIVDAVVAAHSHAVVHRDLKPSNVMVLAGDRVKVLDFGLAKLRESPASAMLPTQELTGEGKIVGTVAYMSPEQAEGKDVDGRSDIFALGVMLYEMATSERPFVGDTSLSVLSSILRNTPRAVTELNPELPRDVWRIVRHCLAKDPDRRYQTAKDLRNELEDLAQSLSSGELAAPTVGSAPRPSRRTPVMLGLAVLGLLAAVVAWQLRARQSPANAPPPTLLHSRLTQRGGLLRWPSISPDGKWVVYVADGDIYLQGVSGQTAINLTKDSPSDETTPAFSPDGETIAFRSTRDGGGIFLMGRTGESVRRLTHGGFQPAWFPDGKSIVYASGEGPQGPERRFAFSELWIVSVDGGEPRRFIRGDAVQPRVSPHGTRIAYWNIPADPAQQRFSSLDEPANREIWTVDRNGGHAIKVAPHDANDWNPVWSPDGQWLYFLSNRSGSMALWRVAIDEASGATCGEPQPLATPAWYVADFSLSADGAVGVYSSLAVSNNIARVAFDPVSATIKGDVELITSGTNDFFQFDVTKDGRFVAVTTSSRTREDLYVLTVADGSLRRLTNDFARDRWPRWSPDGNSIYFYSDRRGYEVWRINADGSDLRQLTNVPGLALMYPALSPDGARLAASDQDVRKLAIYDTRDFSKPLQVVTASVEPKVGALQVHDWSPDGRSFLMAALSSTGAAPRLWSYAVDTGTTRRITECGDAAAWMQDGRRIVCQRSGHLVVVDVSSGRTTELRTPALGPGGVRLAEGDSQMFFLTETTSADIWVARFGQPGKPQ